MGNIINQQPDIKLLKHLDNFHIKILTKDEIHKLEEFRFRSQFNENSVKLFTTYEYQKIRWSLRINFILCKSKSIDDIIKNITLGYESIAYMSWDYHKSKDPLYVNDIWTKTKISAYDIDLVEMHATKTSKSCKTLRYHDYLKYQDDKSFYQENDLIDGIIFNFVYYPIIKNLLLTQIIKNYNIPTDIRLHILMLYIRSLYIF